VIRINLLGVERPKAKKGIAFDIGQQLTLACSLIVVLGALAIGWWYWSLTEASARVDADLAAARQEAARLQAVLSDVRAVEERRAQFQQRVALIEQLRSGQSVPVQLLDHVSRSLPDMLWLTDVAQDGNTLTIEGQSTTLIALSDFVGNLGQSPLLQKPIEIVSSQVATVSGTGPQAAPPVELINFEVKALVAMPGGPPGVAPVAATAAAPVATTGAAQ
jgi:type IV pilus assembly protein PilN